MKVLVHSNIGKRRSSNQDYADYYTTKEGQTLFVLCDGVGGHQAGDVASKMTTDFIGQRFEQVESLFTTDSIHEWLLKTIHDVNQYIYQHSIEHSELVGMGTTLVMAVAVEDQIIIAHVGDSRAYAYHQGQLTQLTEDHSLVNELIRSGEITVEEGFTHPRRNVVTESIGGTSTVSPEINQISLTDIEVLMLCSDGLSNMVSHEELTQFFNEKREEDDFGHTLINAANNAGGTDNITVIVVSDLHHSVLGEG